MENGEILHPQIYFNSQFLKSWGKAITVLEIFETIKVE